MHRTSSYERNDIHGFKEGISAQIVRRLAEEELAYLFRHALTQEAAYESLLLKHRREIHRRVAESYGELYGDRLDEFAALLAQHYAEAGDDGKTLEYAWRAAQVAGRLFATAEVRLHCSKALDALSRLPDSVENRRRKIDISLQLLGLPFSIGSSERELTDLHELEALARTLLAGEATARSDRLRLLGTHLMKLSLLFRRNELPQTLSDVEQFMTEAQELSAPDYLATAQMNLGGALMYQGHFSKALPIVAQAMDVWKDSPELWQYGASFMYFTMCLAGLGQVREGLAQAERAIERAQGNKNWSVRGVLPLGPCVHSLDGSRIFCDGGV